MTLDEDMQYRLRPDEFTYGIAVAMCKRACDFPQTVHLAEQKADLTALPGSMHWREPMVYVGLVMPGKDYGIWTEGQPVETAPGFFLGRTPDECRQARDQAEEAARRQLADRAGSVAYCRVDSEGYFTRVRDQE